MTNIGVLPNANVSELTLAGRATGATPYEGGGTGLSEGESRAVAAA